MPWPDQNGIWRCGAIERMCLFARSTGLAQHVNPGPRSTPEGQALIALTISCPACDGESVVGHPEDPAKRWIDCPRCKGMGRLRIVSQKELSRVHARGKVVNPHFREAPQLEPADTILPGETREEVAGAEKEAATSPSKPSLPQGSGVVSRPTPEARSTRPVLEIPKVLNLVRPDPLPERLSSLGEPDPLLEELEALCPYFDRIDRVVQDLRSKANRYADIHPLTLAQLLGVGDHWTQSYIPPDNVESDPLKQLADAGEAYEYLVQATSWVDTADNRRRLEELEKASAQCDSLEDWLSLLTPPETSLLRSVVPDNNYESGLGEVIHHTSIDGIDGWRLYFEIDYEEGEPVAWRGPYELGNCGTPEERGLRVLKSW